MDQDYYAILDLSPQATQDDIKKAYRRLAKTHHPDVSPDDGMFSKVTAAYTVLKDPAKRAQYDQRHVAGLENIEPFVHTFFDEYVNALPVLKVNMSISLKDSLVGGIFNIKVRVPAAQKAHPDCPWCNGSGQRVNHSSGFPTVERCDCDSGQAQDIEVELGMEVPRRAKNGDVITMDSPQGVPYRQVKVTLNVIPDDKYTMSGARPQYTLNLTTFDLVVGAKKRIPFFEKWVTLDIPPGTSAYDKFEVTHDAYPDITIKVKVNASTPLLDEQQIEEFREAIQNF